MTKSEKEVALSPQIKVSFRSAERADLASIIRLLADDELGSLREEVSEPVAKAYHDAFDEIHQSQDNELLVAIVDTEIVGVLQVTYIPSLTLQGGRRAQIEGVRVASTHRSQGIGRLMIAEVVNRANAAGCHLVQLTTNKARRRARSFYESLGFETTHEGLKLVLEQ